MTENKDYENLVYRLYLAYYDAQKKKQEDWFLL